MKAESKSNTEMRPLNDIDEARLDYFKQQKTYSGEAAYKNLALILRQQQTKKAMIVCGKSYHRSFIKAYIESLPGEFVYFSDYKVNPDYEDIIKGVKLFKESGCELVISIGGGSSIDVAKCIKLFAWQKAGELWLNCAYCSSPIIHICLPTTAGSGSEATRFAVIYYQKEKVSVHHDCLLPDYAILESKFLATLSPYQKRACLLDAAAQAIESYLGSKAIPQSKNYAAQAIRLILDNAADYLAELPSSFAKIMLAANLAGKAINISETSIPHALSYKIVATFKIAHGHAVALTLAAYWKFIVDNISSCCDSRGQDYLVATLSELNQLFGGQNSYEAIAGFQAFLNSMQLEAVVIDNSSALVRLAEACKIHPLKNSPVTISPDNIRDLLFASLCNINVKQIQEECLTILKVVDEFCHEHNINYFMTEGSLLGTIRHQGFIPWDDDLDIAMERSDYQRFIHLAATKLPPGYKLYWHTTVENWWPGVPRVAFSENGRFERFFPSKKKGEEILPGASVDIFPLDSVPKKQSFPQKFQWAIRACFKRAVRYNQGVSQFCDSPLALALIIIGKLFSFKFLIRQMEKWQTKYNHPDNPYLFLSASNYSWVKATFAKSNFASTLLLPFEDMMVPVPAGYDEILRSTYGDYLQAPPIEKRISEHRNRLKAEYRSKVIKPD